MMNFFFFFFSSRRRHTRFDCDWSSDVCSSDLAETGCPGCAGTGCPDSGATGCPGCAGTGCPGTAHQPAREVPEHSDPWRSASAWPSLTPPRPGRTYAPSPSWARGVHRDQADHRQPAGQLKPYPTCAGCLGGMAAFDALTATSSHESCEAVTDPVPGSEWYDQVNGEIGDICAWALQEGRRVQRAAGGSFADRSGLVEIHVTRAPSGEDLGRQLDRVGR